MRFQIYFVTAGGYFIFPDPKDTFLLSSAIGATS